MRLLAALLALPLCTAPAFAEMAIIKPAQIGEIFCLGVMGNDEDVVRSVASPELRTLIAYAEARNRTIASANPDEKPPLGDGVPWTSFPDRADTCSLGSIAIEGTEARVTIGYGFAATPDADYSDTLNLIEVPNPLAPERPFWRINDIRYTIGGTLREVLVAAFETP